MDQNEKQQQNPSSDDQQGGQHEIVDNYSDNLKKDPKNLPDEPDYGWKQDADKPLSPEEYAKMQKEARQPGEHPNLHEKKDK